MTQHFHHFSGACRNLFRSLFGYFLYDHFHVSIDWKGAQLEEMDIHFTRFSMVEQYIYMIDCPLCHTLQMECLIHEKLVHVHKCIQNGRKWSELCVLKRPPVLVIH